MLTEEPEMLQSDAFCKHTMQQKVQGHLLDLDAGPESTKNTWQLHFGLLY